MGLVPVGTGSAQQQFGRLHVGSQDCWILLGSQPDGQPGPGLSSDYAALESFFAELTELLRPLGNTDICIYREQNLWHPARRWAGCGAGLGALGGEDQRTGRASRARADDL